MKFPVYFLHLWLPKAHVEAPTTASMLLAGLMLKLGTAGFLRIMRRMHFLDITYWLFVAFIGIILASVRCAFQRDVKSIAAYSSVAHMSFIFLSLNYVSLSGKVGSLMLMLSHGYTSTLIFYLIGEFYHISRTRILYYINSFFNSSMMFGIIFSLVILSNSGVPPSLSFLSEFLIVVGGLLLIKYLFVLVFLYFVVSFYYSLFMLTSALIGKDYYNVSRWGVGFGIPLVYIMYNIFWVSLMY